MIPHAPSSSIVAPAEVAPTLNQPCTCAAEFPTLHADVESLHRLMADGRSQRAASAMVWGSR